MLKLNLNTSASYLVNKDHEVIFQTMVNKSQKKVYKFFYEQKNLNYQSEIYEVLNEDLIEIFLPHGVTIKQIFLYKIYLEYLNKTYKFLRILYNLPIRKIRTHGISKKRKWLNTLAVSYCSKTTPLFKKLKISKARVQILFFCEFINSLWFLNWYDDWFSAYKTRIKNITKNPHIKWKYDIFGLQQGKAVFFNTKKKKTKHNRKKSIVLKNTYNIGFNYGFSIIYLKKILISLQKKN